MEIPEINCVGQAEAKVFLLFYTFKKCVVSCWSEKRVKWTKLSKPNSYLLSTAFFWCSGAAPSLGWAAKELEQIKTAWKPHRHTEGQGAWRPPKASTAKQHSATWPLTNARRIPYSLLTAEGINWGMKASLFTEQMEMFGHFVDFFLQSGLELPLFLYHPALMFPRVAP